MAMSERDQRTLKIGGIVLGVLVVGFLLLKVLGGGGGGEEQGVGPPVVPGSPSASPTPTTGPSGGPPVVLVFSGRDPFSPPPALAGPSGSASPSTSPTTSTSPTSHAIVLPSTIVGGKILTLERTYVEGGVDKVDVRVDTRQVVGLEAGDDVGDGVRLDSISGRCATFSSGDGSFTLCLST